MVFGIIEPARVWMIHLDNVGQKKGVKEEKMSKGREKRQGRARRYTREREGRRGRGTRRSHQPKFSFGDRLKSSWFHLHIWTELDHRAPIY